MATLRPGWRSLSTVRRRVSIQGALDALTSAAARRERWSRTARGTPATVARVHWEVGAQRRAIGSASGRQESSETGEERSRLAAILAKILPSGLVLSSRTNRLSAPKSTFESRHRGPMGSRSATGCGRNVSGAGSPAPRDFEQAPTVKARLEATAAQSPGVAPWSTGQGATLINLMISSAGSPPPRPPARS